MSRSWLVAAGLVAVLSACTAPTPATPAGPVPVLDGTSWTVTHISGVPVAAGAVPSMDFRAGALAGSTGCNRFTATYTEDGPTLAVRLGALTEMACADDVMAQERRFTAALAGLASLRRLDDGRLELLDGSGTVALALAEVHDRPLEGTRWLLSGISSGEVTSSVVAGADVTLTLSGGTLTGRACNQFRGPVEAGETGSFRAGPLVSTKLACASADLARQEVTVLQVLEQATAWTVDGSTLTISAGSSALVFTAS